MRTQKRAALAALFCFLAPALAQEHAPVVAPEVKAGDRWTYQRMDYESGRPAGGRYEMRVEFAGRGVIQVVSIEAGREGEIDTTFTSEWNAVSAAGRVFNPHTGWLKFPLRAGATHEASFDVIMPHKGSNTRNERKVTVAGWEDIVVPAGKFRALKVISEGRYQGIGNTFASGMSRNVIWYVPEVKRWVKLTREIRPAGRGMGEHAGEELVEFKLQ